MLNVTNIPAPRVPLMDPATGLISREWYRFFFNLFNLTGAGQSDTTVEDLMVAPQLEGLTQLLPDFTSGPQWDGSQTAAAPAAIDVSSGQIASELATLSGAVQSLQLQPKPLEVHPTPYGAFYDTTTQTGSTTAGTTITFNSTDVSAGVRIGTPTSRIYVNEPGVYNFQFSIQTQNTDAAVSDINLWLRINGADVAGSNGLISIPAKHAGADGHSIVGWNYYLTLAANDYIELVWLPSAVTTTIQYYAAGALAPATYSVILTACKVNLTTG